MSTDRSSAANRLLFAVLALAMVAMTLVLPKVGHVSSNRSVTAVGELLAFMVELPFYFWFFVLRGKGNSPLYAVPVAVIGYLFCRSAASGADPVWIAWGGGLCGFFASPEHCRDPQTSLNGYSLPRIENFEGTAGSLL